MMPGDGLSLIRAARCEIGQLNGSGIKLGRLASEIRASMLTPIKVGDKLFNLPIIALIAHFKYHGSL